MSSDLNPTVLFREHPTPGGQRIGFAQLNAERSLNALTLEMVRLLDGKLRDWANDAGIAIVVLSGAGPKAFCAGGDIRKLLESIKAQPAVLPGLDFFAAEYSLDYRIHRYPKPVLVWGGGIVFGGGIGLMAGASHRVVTETSKLAMPETRIGLFPDVGASHFLDRMPRTLGRFYGMTGATLDAHDSLATGLADYFIANTGRDALWYRLETSRWHDDAAANATALDVLLQSFCAQAGASVPESPLAVHGELLDRLVTGDFADTYRNITSHVSSDPWLASAIATLRTGSPTSAALSFELQRRLADRSLADVFRTELTVAVRCCQRPDFAEGVRALLIDKDNHPQWSPSRIEEVTPEWIESFFSEPRWPLQTHPLEDLD
ncbi:enoyl-CoA hydratase/isomerase family protein [Povalibacter sp.]|uniref:enoyl-CoA hydratase/isomerase family protein n=1 Tax=Povalibacter sp. TaxID=1962978 RepID=UPI002F3EB360